MAKELSFITDICIFFGLIFGFLLMTAPIVKYEGYNTPSLSNVFCYNNDICISFILLIQYILDILFGLLIFLSCLCFICFKFFERLSFKNMGRILASFLRVIVYPTGIYHLIDGIIRLFY